MSVIMEPGAPVRATREGCPEYLALFRWSRSRAQIYRLSPSLITSFGVPSQYLLIHFFVGQLY